MFAHERSLVQKYQNKPFALLGVNTDETRQTLALVQSKDHLTWRSWWDGPDGPIVSRWKVSGFPSLFLLDRKGLVRWESLGVPDLKVMDGLIEQLIQEAEAAGKST